MNNLQQMIVSILKDVTYQGTFGNPTEEYLLDKANKIINIIQNEQK